MPFITGEGDREILQIIARKPEPAARPDLGDAENQADATKREEQQVAELPPLPDPQPQNDLAGTTTGARPLEEAEPKVLLVVEAAAAAPGGRADGGVGTGRRRLRRLGGRAPDALGPRRARGADLELDLAAGAALERVGAAGHVASSGDAGAMQARQEVAAASCGPRASAAVLGLVAHVAVGAPARQADAVQLLDPEVALPSLSQIGRAHV